MNNYLYLANYGIAVSALTISIIGLILTLTVHYSDKRYRMYFVLIFTFMMAYSISNITVWVVSENHGQLYAMISYIGLFCESFFSSLLMPVLTMFLLFCAGKNWRRSPYFYTTAALWLIYFILLVITQFTEWIYYYTPDNVYYRGPYYAVLLVPPTLMMVVNLFALFRVKDSLSRRQLCAFLIYILVPLMCMLVQMFSYGLLMTVLGSTVASVIMLSMILLDQLDKFVKQSRENANLRANTLFLQMRPHFIYNTMMGIYYLCDKDVQKAKQVTLDFTTYLRKNFAAIASEDTVPFSDELEHSRAYLAVEQAQFVDTLFVSFDTPHTMFRVPPLTLQPIVENSVKHGMKSSKDPIHISVVTRKTDKGSEIIVEDDGSGFKPADNNEPHIALNNIRQRLEMMCSGSLEITARDGGGTSVKVTIPALNE